MKTLLAIPVYNEQRYVQGVLDEVRRFTQNILVIDDGSTDNTPLMLARQPVEVIRHSRNRGYGRSLIDAFRWAQCYSFDWLITMDCDQQHEPASLPDFYAAINHDVADVISGSRYLGSEVCGAPPPADRRTINASLTGRMNKYLGLKITDTFCGYKAYRVSAIKKLRLDEEGYAFPLQFWVQAAAHDLHVIEVPIRLIYNDTERSFGGPLDDPDRRMTYYNTVLARELAKFENKFGHVYCEKCAAKDGDWSQRTETSGVAHLVTRD